MSTSNGQCCGDCVTTRVYAENGRELWKTSFGTDTVDVYGSGSHILVIGDESIVFQHLDEIKVYDSGNNKHDFVTEFNTTIRNYSNFGVYDKKGNVLGRDKFYEYDSNNIPTNKVYSYSPSFRFIENSGYIPQEGSQSGMLTQVTTDKARELSNKYSYPFGTYHPRGQKYARVFEYKDKPYIVTNNTIFEHNSGDYELKKIHFVGASFNIPSIEGSSIYLGQDKYCYNYIDIKSKCLFVSGYPTLEKKESIDIVYNYEANLPSLQNYSGDMGSFNFIYLDKRYNLNTIGFEINYFKSSGSVPEASIRLLSSGCNFRDYNPNDIQYIYRGLKKHPYSYYDYETDSMIDASYFEYAHGTGFPLPGCEFVSGTPTWEVKGYYVDNSSGIVSISLDRVVDVSSSGLDYFRYKGASSFEPICSYLQTGYLSHNISYHNLENNKTYFEPFSISQFTNSGFLYEQNRILKDRLPQYDFTTTGVFSGRLKRLGSDVGSWTIYNPEITLLNKDSGNILTKFDYSIQTRDESYDIEVTAGSGQHYGMTLYSLFNNYETVTYPTFVNKSIGWNLVDYPCSGLDLIRYIFSRYYNYGYGYLGFGGLQMTAQDIINCFGIPKMYAVEEGISIGPTATISPKSEDFPFFGEYNNIGTVDIGTYKEYLFSTTYSVPNGLDTLQEPIEIMTRKRQSDFFVPACFTGATVQPVGIAYSGVEPSGGWGIHNSGCWYHNYLPYFDINTQRYNLACFIVDNLTGSWSYLNTGISLSENYCVPVSATDSLSVNIATTGLPIPSISKKAIEWSVGSGGYVINCSASLGNYFIHYYGSPGNGYADSGKFPVIIVNGVGYGSYCIASGEFPMYTLTETSSPFQVCSQAYVKNYYTMPGRYGYNYYDYYYNYYYSQGYYNYIFWNDYPSRRYDSYSIPISQPYSEITDANKGNNQEHFLHCAINNCNYYGYYWSWGWYGYAFNHFWNQGTGIPNTSYVYHTEGKDYNFVGGSNFMPTDNYTVSKLDTLLPDGLYVGTGVLPATELFVESFNNWKNTEQSINYSIRTVPSSTQYSTVRQNSLYGLLNNNELKLLPNMLSEYNYR